ncbi:hypothetical protein [Parapedobacter tibetensis]|uniref:hypothetical protein n=1 Tax=Parapedobacter tibetensis TaxID=2972951 RepID=UPI00214DDA64|nr:hypothetical protein [Parapedobacter tibetensis]
MRQSWRCFLTDQPVYTFLGAGNKETTLHVKAADPGLHRIEVTVTDADGSSMTRTIGVHVREEK